LHIDINGLSQIEIEEMFSDDSVNEYIAVEIAPLLEQLPDTYFDGMSELLGKDSTDFIYNLVTTFSNPKVTTWKHDVRTMDIENALKFVASTLDGDFPKSADVLRLSEGIIFDVVTQQDFIEELQEFRSKKRLVFDYGVPEDVLELQQLKFFKLPLFEEPKPWKEGESGGYYTNDNKCTLNRGEGKQPQAVLDMLNTLQANSYVLSPLVNYEDKLEATTQSLMKKKGYDYGFAHNIAETTLLSFKTTIDLIGDKPYYFQWDYDFRGRMYCKGYNLSTQGDTYTKGSNLPYKEF